MGSRIPAGDCLLSHNRTEYCGTWDTGQCPTSAHKEDFVSKGSRWAALVTRAHTRTRLTGRASQLTFGQLTDLVSAVDCSGMF
jgi:hypothetical protein